MSLFQTNTIRAKTARMSHRYSLRFDGLNEIMDIASKRNDKNYGKSNAKQNRWDALSNVIGSFTDAKNSLELSLLSVSLPSIELETVDLYRFHDSVKHITKFSPMGDMSVVFYDYVNGSASAIMSVWHGLVGDKYTGAISFKEEYVLPEARFIEFGPKAPMETEGSETILAEHRVVNLFPKSVSLGDHSYESAEIRKVTVNFAVEAVFPMYYERGTTGSGNPIT